MTKEIKLTQGKCALVDDADFERLNQFKWCAVKARHLWYAIRSTGRRPNRKNVGMHNFVLPTEPGYTPDHKDGNGLNNQRDNLRPATKLQQQGNKRKQAGCASKYKGVRPHASKRNPWEAQIRRNGKLCHLGNFSTQELAARAYDAAAREFFGEFANCNFKEIQ